MNTRFAGTLCLGLATAGAAMAGSLDAVSNLTAHAERAERTAAGSAGGSSGSSGSGAQSSTASSAKFTGRNGKVSVNGDLVEARDGLLTVNGKAYGKVENGSVVQYVVRDSERTLMVDGVARKPLGQQ
jgi:hypothetical protein